MTVLPRVERIMIQAEIPAVCKEFTGPYELAPAYVSDVERYLTARRIPFREREVLGVYFDDPATKPPGSLRSIQGILVDGEPTVDPPYFVYRMEPGEYLYTRVAGNPPDVLPQAYQSMLRYMNDHGVGAGRSGGHQIVKMEEGVMVFHVYWKCDSPPVLS